MIDTIRLIWFDLNRLHRKTCNYCQSFVWRIANLIVARSYEMNQLKIDSYKMSYSLDVAALIFSSLTRPTAETKKVNDSATDMGNGWGSLE